MIVRGLRSPSRVKADKHQYLERTLEELRAENKQLRFDVLRLEQRLLQAQQQKLKYKTKYREAKQKVEILGLVGLYSRRQQDHYDCCLSPRTKTTRVHTASEDEFHSLKLGAAHSEFEDNFSTKPYLPDPDDYQISGKRHLSPVSTTREEPREDTKILQSLIKVHQTLQKLSMQIDRTDSTQGLTRLEDGLYRKLEQVVEKVAQLQARDSQRDRERQQKEHDREQQRLSRGKSAKRYGSCLKAVEQIGKDLLDFKVDE